jgi:hypothetical protein
LGAEGLNPPPTELALDELAALVAQLPDVPLTLDEALPAWTEELLLQLYAIATFDVGLRIKNIPAMEIVMAIVQIRLFILSFQQRVIKGCCKFILNIVTETPIEPEGYGTSYKIPLVMK